MRSIFLKSFALFFLFLLSLSACSKKQDAGPGAPGAQGTPESGPSVQDQHQKQEAADEEEVLAIILDETKK